MDIWAIVELMGHVRLAGRLTEVEVLGGKMGRIDIPMNDGTTVTQFFGGGSVYRITAVTEETARGVAKECANTAPISAWDARRLLAPPSQAGREDTRELATEEKEDDLAEEMNF